MSKQNGKERMRRARNAERYATRQSLGHATGPLVAEVEVRRSGRIFLVRRLDLFELFTAQVWSRPITNAVRKMMASGAVTVMATVRNDEMEFWRESALTLVQEAVIVPPEGLLDGSLPVDAITAEMCRPLFVTEDPDVDQSILVSWSQHRDRLDEIAALRGQLATDGLSKAAAAKLRGKIDEMAEAAAGYTVLHWEDIAALATAILDVAGGANRKFRPVPMAPVETDAVGGVAGEEGQRDDDGPDDGAEAAA